MMKHKFVKNEIVKETNSKEDVTRIHENPIRHESFQPLSFSLKDVKATMIHEAGGSYKLNKNQRNIIEHLQRMDEDGDGTISLLEIISMEQKSQKSKNQQKKLKKIGRKMIFFFPIVLVLVHIGISTPFKHTKRRKNFLESLKSVTCSRFHQDMFAANDNMSNELLKNDT